ncbi:MAG: type I pantothenate kinase [Firmicutes bacterium]|nr:type I pantothenate kinase [Bacillota bacterium]
MSQRRVTPYVQFTRAEWAVLREATPLTLSEAELAQLRGLNERVSMREVEHIYLPLTRLLHLYVAATMNLYEASHVFLGTNARKVPYIIGVGGSVAVGKSTMARILQTLLARSPGQPKVDLVTTDGFLYPNKVLIERGILDRKGFPESYDIRRLLRFLYDVKSGLPEVTAPVYSHLYYDILSTERLTIRRPDIIVLEGLNVLQTPSYPNSLSPAQSAVFVSDFFDFSIYVDAKERHIRRWYVERFHALRETAFQNPQSYFHRYASLTDDEAEATALDIWERINGVNLRENILPTRNRAQLILEKGEDHAISSVSLRKL